MDSANFEEIITCGVCLEPFNEGLRCPRILSCGHSFCQSCLVKMFESRTCPTCRSEILFPNIGSIPVNFSLKSLINIRSFRCQVPMTNAMSNLNLQSDVSRAHSSKGQQEGTSRVKHLSEGFCSEHNYFKELRCMNCDVWICAMCVVLKHKKCRTLVVKEAYEELKTKFSKKVEKELLERETISERLNESLRMFNDESNSLISEIKEKELEIMIKEQEIMIKEQQVMNHAKRVEELLSLKSEEHKFCDKLNKLREMAESSTKYAEISKTTNELDKLLEEGKKYYPKLLKNLLPQTIEALEIECQNGPVYVVEDRYDGTRYGRVAVKDGWIWVHHFQLEKPDAKFYFFKDLFSQFNDLPSQFTECNELPQTVFLQLTPQCIGGEAFDVVIETEGLSWRARNFVLLCSGLKGSSYNGLTVEYLGNSSCCQVYPGPPPVLGGIKNDDAKTPLKEAGVYGMTRMDSYFGIQFKDHPSISDPKFGVVITGLQNLKVLKRSCTVTECGLMI